MKPSTAALAGGSSAALVAITAADVTNWLPVAERIAASPAGLLVFCLLVLVLLAWLLFRQWRSGDDCEDRITKLMDAMRTLHTLLMTDDRYADQLPPWSEFIAGSVDAKAMARGRSATAFNRDPRTNP